MVMNSSASGQAIVQRTRNANGQFKLGDIGGPGRPRGSRNRLSEQFIADLQADWEQHGSKVIEMVRRTDPAAYLRTVALMVRPVHHAGVEDDPFRDLSTDELRKILIDDLHACCPDLRVVPRPLINQPKNPPAILPPLRAGR
jgi:hypothetical protein